MEDKNTNKNNALNDILSACSPTLTGVRKRPPLERWSPTSVHDFDIVIKDNGDWYHEGVKMTRQSLVDLFAGVLWGQIDNGVPSYFLKTPTDLYRITVEDSPLFITMVDRVEYDGVSWIVFTTSHGDKIVLDDKPLYFKDFVKNGRSERRLYIDTKFHLTARIGANVLYHLIDMGELIDDDEGVVLVLESGGVRHRLVEVSGD